MALALTRKINESILIGDDIRRGDIEGNQAVNDERLHTGEIE